MIFTLFLRNSFLLIYNISSLLQTITTKSLKKIFLFVLLYLFFNLYLFPTIALCEIDYDLLDRTNNTYKGSKIVYETPEAIVTQEDMDYANYVCDTILMVCTIVILITFPFVMYEGE